MSLRFFFRFSGFREPVEIPVQRLIAEHPALARLHAHLEASVRAAEGRAGAGGRPGRIGNLADAAFAGFIARCMRAFGEDYIERVSGALERIGHARENIGEQLDRALRGELPDFARLRDYFHDIDAAFPEVIDPANATPPAAPSVGSGVPLTSAPRSLVSFLNASRNRLTYRARTLMERANRLEPEALNGVLEATRWPNPVERAQPLIEALFERLRAQGFDRSETNQLLGALEEWSTPDEVRAASDATIDALSGTDLPRVRGLQQALRASPVLRALFRASPEQLRTWWRDYIRWPRPYRFGLYSWFRMHHIRGALGEWTSAFDLGRSGVLIFLKGPKPEVTTGGTDLVAIDRNTGEVYSIDNKATLRTRVLRGVTALMRNFPQNLAEDVRALRADIAGRLEPAIESVLRRLESAERRIRAVVELLGPEGETRKQALDDNVEVTLRSGERVRVQQAITDILQEHGITRLITNAGGVLERISTALEEAGIEIENLNEVVEDPVDTE